jgi:hypothetical protein
MNPSVPSILKNLKPFNIVKIATGNIAVAVTSKNHLLIWGVKTALFQNGDFYLKYNLKTKIKDISINGNESKSSTIEFIFTLL